MIVAPPARLPGGTLLRPLHAHADERGVFTELYRLEWETGVTPIQWNAVRSGALSAIFELSGDEPASLLIPCGVAHGFYFHEPSLHVYAVTEYWDPDDELGCHWADPELELPWPDPAPRVSERDAASRPLRALWTS